MELTLDAEETELIRSVLTQYLADLRGEIGKTDSRELRQDLHRREAMLQKIVGRLAQG
jgi:hypothetical protein